MTDYEEMYLIMARAAEKATRILLKAPQTCEERYLFSDDTAPILFPLQDSSESLEK